MATEAGQPGQCLVEEFSPGFVRGFRQPTVKGGGIDLQFVNDLTLGETEFVEARFNGSAPLAEGYTTW
jgi:hypothetical protein